MLSDLIANVTNQNKGPHKSSKLRDEALIDLERKIVNGELEPGQWVSETYLIEITGHSRASVRSAIQRLSDQGLLIIVPRRGAQVCPIDYTQQFRCLEFRRSAEILIAKSAAKRASKKQREKFAEFATEFKLASTTGHQEVMTELDSKFFALMLNAADNSFAARALTSVKGLSRRFWILNQEKYGDFSIMAHAFSDIADAIATANQSQAEAAVERLIDYVEKFTLEVVGFDSSTSTFDSLQN